MHRFINAIILQFIKQGNMKVNERQPRYPPGVAPTHQDPRKISKDDDDEGFIELSTGSFSSKIFMYNEIF